MIKFSLIVTLHRPDCTLLHIDVPYAEFLGYRESELMRPKNICTSGFRARHVRALLSAAKLAL